ncbi:hypothetical protein MANES_03G099500v8 [Manihot esculenta]|uniref:Uncharacterized protein n=1 Tax=Manihot esculenta TaxID=3983 RepID=A0A2C9W8P1_MANES|nr:hypothetical protein MANES_03G099500v8 [Manihot esculenta]
MKQTHFNFPSSILFILLLLSLSHLTPLSCLPLMRTKLQDAELLKVSRSSSDAQIMSFRKELHEVHSGPNPIGNSIPQQKWAKRSPKSP